MFASTSLDRHQLKEEYEIALRSFLAEGGEARLQQGYEIGKKAIEGGFGVLDIAAIHQEALVDLCKASPSESAKLLKDSTSFFEESLSPFEMTHRSFSEANATLKNLNQELEQRLRRRTLELENVNAELNDFAYIVSHDLKAPLAAISSVSELLLYEYGQALEEDGKELLRLLSGRAVRMQDLIDSILRYSKVGRTKEEKLEVDFGRLISGVLETLAPPSHIRCEMEGPFPTLLVEKTAMQQVFQNLIGNAVKFIDKPEGHIKISCAREGEFWGFTISDNGCGIPAAQRERIFQLFVVLNPAQNPKSTGVGLTIARRVIEMHGGKITVESEPGVGSTFQFTLPKSL